MTTPLFSEEDLQRIRQLNPQLFEDRRPRTTSAQLPPDLAEKLLNGKTVVPARVYSSDTPLHVDIDRTTSSHFEAAKIIYLTPSPGEFVLGDDTYPLDSPGILYSIPSGTIHGTRNTENTPRISLGPFNEFGRAVGVLPESGFNYYDVDNTTVLYFDSQPINSLYMIKSFTDPIIGGVVPTGQIFIGWSFSEFDSTVYPAAGDYSIYLTTTNQVRNLYPIFASPPSPVVQITSPSFGTIASANVVGDSSTETLSRAGMALVQARRQEPTMRFPDHASYLRYQQGRARIQIRRQAASNTILIPPTIPSAPTITSNSIQSYEYNQGLIQFNFTPPANIGGSPILYYTIRAFTSVSGPDILYDIQQSSYIFPILNFITISPLTVNIPYTFRLSATNATGTSPFSAEFGPITIPGRPSVPQNIVVTPGDGQVTISFDPVISPNDGGYPVTSYNIKTYMRDGDTLVPPISTGLTIPRVITGLENGTEYYFVINAANINGSGGQVITDGVIPESP